MPARDQVFVSYSHRDAEWLDRLNVHLKPLIRQGTLDLWADTRIAAGMVWGQEINSALARAGVAVLLVTPNYLASDFIANRELPPLLEAASNEEVAVLWIAVSASLYEETPIVRYEAVNDPARPLDSLTPADLNRTFVEIAKVIKAKAAALAAACGGTEYFDVPHERNPFFSGRDGCIQNLRVGLLERGRAALCGLGGIGKTQTVVEYAYRYRDQYRATFWTGADSEAAINTGYARIAAILDLPQKNAADRSALLEAVKRWFEQESDWLFILDDADVAGFVVPWLPLSARGRALEGQILLTSRRSILQDFGIVNPVEADELKPPDDLTFFRRRTGRTLLEPVELTACQELAHELGYLPLALEHAAAYLVEKQARFVDYLASYRRDRAKRLGTALSTTWAMNLNALSHTPASGDLLRASAFLAPDDIPLELLLLGAAHLGDHVATTLAATTEDPLVLDEMLEPLTRFSLIHRDVGGRKYSVHRLLQSVVQDSMSTDARHMWAERAIRAVNTAFPDAGFRTWPDCERLLPHALACRALIKKWGFEFAEAGRLLAETASYLDDRAQYSEAEPLYNEALAIQEKALGADHLDTAMTVNNLAILNMNQGRYSDAEPLYRRALEIREKALGAESPDVAVSLNNLGVVLRLQGRHDEAEPLYQRALAIDEGVLGAAHAGTATSLNNLGALYFSQEQYPKAEELFRRALSIDEKVLGQDDPSVATDIGNLASVYVATARYAEAEPLYTRALGIREKSQGPGHADTATVLTSIAKLRQKQGRYGEAEALYQRALAVRERVLPAAHPVIETARADYNTLLEIKRTAEPKEDP